MKLIRPSYEIIEQGPGIQGVYDMIERCGKVSYKSDFKGGDVAKRFVESRAKERHGAVLEFGTVYMKVCVGSPMYDEDYMPKMEAVMFYKRNPYSRVTEGKELGIVSDVKVSVTAYHITSNYRVVVENNRPDDLKYLCEPTEFHEKRYAVKFITDIGLGRDYLRHRVMSMVMESTRFINYNDEKFGEECSFVIPPWIPEETLATGENICWWDGDWVDMNRLKIVKVGSPELKSDPVEVWLGALSSAETEYRILNNLGWKPQQARGVLPLSTKTEFVLCGFADAWTHFFRLRSDIAATGKPHPMSLEIANPLKEEFIEKGYITRESLKHEAFGHFDVIISDTDLT